MEVTVKKLCKSAIVYKIAPSGNSKLVGHKRTSVGGKCCQVLATKMLSRGFVLSQSTFHLVTLCHTGWFLLHSSKHPATIVVSLLTLDLKAMQ